MSKKKLPDYLMKVRRTWADHGRGVASFAPRLDNLRAGDADKIYMEAFSTGALLAPCYSCKHYSPDGDTGFCMNFKAHPFVRQPMAKLALEHSEYLANTFELGTKLYPTPPEVPAIIHACEGYDCSLPGVDARFMELKARLEKNGTMPDNVSAAMVDTLANWRDICRLIAHHKRVYTLEEWACGGLGLWLRFASCLTRPVFHKLGAIRISDKRREGMGRAFFKHFKDFTEKLWHVTPPQHVIHYFDKVVFYVRGSAFEEKWWGKPDIKGKAPSAIYIDEVADEPIPQGKLDALRKSMSSKVFFTSTPTIKDKP